MKVILINGVGGSGKDSFTHFVKSVGIQKGKLVITISTIDPIKDVYLLLGWNGEKTPEHRLMLNTLKNIWVENTNGLGPISWIIKRIEPCKDHIDLVFIMIREYDQLIDTYNILDKRGYKVFTMNVIRDGIFISQIEQKLLDEFPGDFKYDFIIRNPTVKEGENFNIGLLQSAKEFWKKLKRKTNNGFTKKVV